jgi:hypothetical protein
MIDLLAVPFPDRRFFFVGIGPAAWPWFVGQRLVISALEANSLMRRIQ